MWRSSGRPWPWPRQWCRSGRLGVPALGVCSAGSGLRSMIRRRNTTGSGRRTCGRGRPSCRPRHRGVVSQARVGVAGVPWAFVRRGQRRRLRIGGLTAHAVQHGRQVCCGEPVGQLLSGIADDHGRVRHLRRGRRPPAVAVVSAVGRRQTEHGSDVVAGAGFAVVANRHNRSRTARIGGR